MQKKSDQVLRLALILGDALALILSFLFAYIIRTRLDPRPYFFESELLEFAKTIVTTVPILLIILAALGLYQKSVFQNPSKIPEFSRLVLASILSVAALITYSFFTFEDIFPVRLMALTSAIISLALLIIERNLVRLVARQIFKKDYGTRGVIIVGNSKSTKSLARYISETPESGYRLLGVVAGKRFIPKKLQKLQRSSLKEALKKSTPDIIFQTDEKNSDYVYKKSIEKHLLYYFVPNETALSSHLGSMELIGNTPAILVQLTPLCGLNAAIKRLFDIIFSLVAIILTAIPMALVWLIIKLESPEASPIYSSTRLTRYNKKFSCYKFRSMKPEYSGMLPEEAFKKMGKPELIKKYRDNGDYIKNDPRITKFGAFIRKTSLDELPQFFNVLKGDISLIGPRALVPEELRTYGDRSTILTVKSGLTGFAQVSGRRDISFEERRALDIYYVKNWSLSLDAQILFKTIISVLKNEGAK